MLHKSFRRTQRDYGRAVRGRATALAGILWAAALGSGPIGASEATIQWHTIMAHTLPPPFVVEPAVPTITNGISFVAATDGQVYINSCFASVSNGDPAIAVDPTNRTVTVSFSEPRTNIACPAIVVPVSGVDGQIAPLKAGDWTFTILQNSYSFSVAETPLPLSVQVLAKTGALQLSWPASGETFALESSDKLSGGNWQAVTNSPAVSSNRVVVLLEASAGNRFFRLHRLP